MNNDFLSKSTRIGAPYGIIFLIFTALVGGCRISAKNGKYSNDNTIAPALQTNPKHSADTSKESGTYTLILGGWLGVDTDTDTVLKKLGQPEKKSEGFYSELTGDFEQVWFYKKQGILLDMSAKSEDSPMRVRLIRVLSPSRLATAEGIGIGTSYSKTKDVYGDKINSEFSDDGRLVIGTIYWGTVIYFKNKKVSGIHIGASEE